MTTNQLGLLAEMRIVYECLKLRVGVARPLDDERYDLIIDLRPRLLGVQCKWAVRRGDCVVIRCLTNRRGPNGFIRRQYQPGEIDAVAAYCEAVDGVYLLPPELSIGRTAVWLRLAPTRNNQ